MHKFTKVDVLQTGNLPWKLAKNLNSYPIDFINFLENFNRKKFYEGRQKFCSLPRKEA